MLGSVGRLAFLPPDSSPPSPLVSGLLSVVLVVEVGNCVMWALRGRGSCAGDEDDPLSIIE